MLRSWPRWQAPSAGGSGCRRPGPLEKSAAAAVCRVCSKGWHRHGLRWTGRLRCRDHGREKQVGSGETEKPKVRIEDAEQALVAWLAVGRQLDKLELPAGKALPTKHGGQRVGGIERGHRHLEVLG